ncbi:MAG: HAMP domain-containing sensor histidine kinase [candidate division KSB1 bacterium]|nr:HAMP domain-containing sensor histidine kinase [candidate division KSB1 bacterium]
MFKIADQGVGIPATEVPKIFDRFYRTANVPGTVKGSGLGLATCESIVRAHGGRIEVESEEGCGSTFIVHLPKKA